MNKTFARPFSFALVLVFIVLAASRCGTKTETAATPTPGTFDYVYTKTLSTACIECHVPTGAATTSNGVQLDFTSKTTAYQTLTAGTVSGVSSSGICGGVHIVSAGTPTSSYLLGVLIASYNVNNFGGVSGCLPYSAHLTDQNLSAEEQTSLVTWIQNGALNN